MRKVAVYTLGCKVNQVESESIKQSFLRKGYQVVDIDEQADVYVINTCTVTHVSDRKSRAMLRRVRRKNPGAVVVATGCFAEISPQSLAGMPEVDIILGNREKERVADIVEQYQPGGRPLVMVGGERPGLSSSPDIIPAARERTRAFVKIEDGCESYCSYCIVPYTRGPVRSKSPEDVCEEIRHLVEAGYREVVLTGIHTGMYGRDLDGWDLSRLLHKLLDSVEGDYRLRLSSLEPVEVSDELVALLEKDRRLCRHLHIPLQSGSDRILRLMNRRYTRDLYRSLLQELAGRIPGLALTADVMVGFPTETEEDFRETLELVEELPFYDLHVFPYSRRPGTGAYHLSPQVDPRLKEQRSRVLLSLARQKKAIFINRLLGQTLMVLVEERVDDCDYEGLTDNYVRVVFPGEEGIKGSLVPVTLERHCGHSARGVVAR